MSVRSKLSQLRTKLAAAAQYAALAPLILIPWDKVDPKIVADDSAPWLGTLRQIGGWILVSAMIMCAIALMLAAAGWGICKGLNIRQGQDIAATAFFVILVCGALIGSASGLVAWSSGWKLV